MPIAMQILRRLSLHKRLAQPLQQRYNAANRSGGLPARSTPTSLEKPLSVPCHEGIQKAVFDHMFDYRQPWSMRKQCSQELRRASIIKQKRLYSAGKSGKIFIQKFGSRRPGVQVTSLGFPLKSTISEGFFVFDYCGANIEFVILNISFRQVLT